MAWCRCRLPGSLVEVLPRGAAWVEELVEEQDGVGEEEVEGFGVPVFKFLGGEATVVPASILSTKMLGEAATLALLFWYRSVGSKGGQVTTIIITIITRSTTLTITLTMGQVMCLTSTSESSHISHRHFSVSLHACHLSLLRRWSLPIHPNTTILTRVSGEGGSRPMEWRWRLPQVTLGPAHFRAEKICAILNFGLSSQYSIAIQYRLVCLFLEYFGFV